MTTTPSLPHAVQFYDDERFLIARVAAFLSEGIQRGEPCVVIATPEHNDAFAAEVRDGGLDTAPIRFFDARSLLDQFIDRQMPSADRFREVVGNLLREAGSGAKPVRAYGEMVDLLWRQGEPDAAIRLEELWNELAREHSFSLLCAYSMGNFYKQSDRDAFDLICTRHDIVRPTGHTEAGDPVSRGAAIAALEQRAAALETEIEHRRQLEARLTDALAERRRSEALLRDFVDNATIGLHWVLADGTIEWANDAELKLLGYTRDEYIGRNIADFHADPRVIEDILRRLGRNEEIHDYEAPLLARDGTVKWVAINSNVLFENGRFVHTRCFSRDITDRKRLEEQNALLLDATTVIAQSLDYRVRLRDLSRVVVPRLADWCLIDIARDDGYDRLAIAHADPELEAHAARLHERWRTPEERDPVRSVLRSGQPLIVPGLSDEDVANFAENEEHRSELIALGLRSLMIVPMLAHGRIVGSIALIASDSRRHYAEADLPLAMDLASRAAGMIEIARLYHIAETNNRAKDEFLATLSHELRTPLTAILGWAKMLTLGGLDEQTLHTAIATIEQSARTQAALVDDLLDVSRVVTGKLSLQNVPVDLREVVSNVLHAMTVAADAKAIRIELVAPDEAVVVQGDATRLQQIVWNLVSNAIKFSDPETRLDVRLEHGAGRARIVVRDHGRGISAPFLPLVFEPFRQADSSSTRSHGGLGLGLAIVKYLVEAHGGAVTAESAGLGRGSTFTVSLPLARRSHGAVIPAQGLADLTGLRILVVDDDPSSSRMLKAAFRHCGAKVDSADSVKNARSAITRERPHFVVTDVAMPEEDGVALIRHLRASPETRAIPVFAVTALPPRPSLQNEFDAFFRKPVDPMEIARGIAQRRTESTAR